MKEETREKIQDKAPLLNHTIFTKELIRRSIIQEDVSEFELYLWDSIFQYLLKYYEFRVVLVCTSYTISCIKRNNFKDEEGKPIDSLYAYFKVALYSNIKRYTTTTPAHIDWFSDNDYD